MMVGEEAEQEMGRSPKKPYRGRGWGAGVAEGERDLGGNEESVTRAGATLANVHQTLSRCHLPLQARHLNPTAYAQQYP